jgi:hypothetical protein
MKKWILLIVVFLQFNCTGKSNRANNESTAADSVTNNYVIEDTRGNDVLIVKSESNIRFSYTEICKSEYEKLKENSKNEILSFPQEKFEETEEDLTIKLANGEILSFVNNHGVYDGEICESCLEIYHYGGFSTKHNLHFYTLQLYGDGAVYLIDEQGISHKIWGEPSFFKDGDLIFCSVGIFFGLEAAPNGIQLYEIKNGNLELIKQEDIEDWLPNEAFWISNDELVMEQGFPYDVGGFPPSKYIKIKIIRE